MTSRKLALRVTLNSGLMITLVYLFMQTIAFLRDNIILGTGDFSSLPRTVGLFLGLYVLPPSIIFSFIIYFTALPLQRVQRQLEAGESITPELAEKTRLRLLSFPKLILTLNFIGFAAGYVVMLVISNKMAELAHANGWIVLVSNLAGGYSFASAQSALNDRAFLPLRNLLGFREIGNRKRGAQHP